MNVKPRVSVVIPTYNRARYLPVAIGSILAQHFKDFELIIVDDGSTDETPDIIRRFTDPRVHLVTNATCTGIAAARNRGLDQACGEYIATLDSDDYSYPQRLARQVAFLDAHPKQALIGSWASWMDEQGRMLSRVKRRPIDADEAAALLIFNSCLTQSSVMARTETLRKYRYNEQFTLSEDFELWVRMVAGGCRIASLPEVLVCQREHPSRTTREKAELITAYEMAIYQYQFDRMGIPHNEIDLQRHHILPRSRKKGGSIDSDYLEWAEQWLLCLEQANRRSGWLEPLAFARVLGRAWATSCYRTKMRHSWQAVRRFARSPLRRAALAGVQRQAALEIAGGPFLAYRLRSPRRREVIDPQFPEPAVSVTELPPSPELSSTSPSVTHR